MEIFNVICVILCKITNENSVGMRFALTVSSLLLFIHLLVCVYVLLFSHRLPLAHGLSNFVPLSVEIRTQLPRIDDGKCRRGLKIIVNEFSLMPGGNDWSTNNVISGEWWPGECMRRTCAFRPISVVWMNFPAARYRRHRRHHFTVRRVGRYAFDFLCVTVFRKWAESCATTLRLYVWRMCTVRVFEQRREPSESK